MMMGLRDADRKRFETYIPQDFGHRSAQVFRRWGNLLDFGCCHGIVIQKGLGGEE